MSGPPPSDDEIDDFFSPEEQLTETLQQEQVQMQTADSLAADVLSQVPAQGESTPVPPTPEPQIFPSTPTAAEVQPTALNQVPITLNVEISRLNLSLQGILDLRPGAILPLDRDLNGSVDLVVEGKLVGRAQLLRIGETLGLRIEQLQH